MGYFQFVHALVRHHFEKTNIWVEFEDLKCNIYPIQNITYKDWMEVQVVINVFDLYGTKSSFRLLDMSHISHIN